MNALKARIRRFYAEWLLPLSPPFVHCMCGLLGLLLLIYIFNQ